MDNEHDLNVYNDTPSNDAQSSCCGKGCAAAAPADDPLVAFRSQSKHVDFNEWAGMWELNREDAACNLSLLTRITGSFQVYALKSSS